MKKPTLVSLGMSCQTSHQLARYVAAHPERATFHKGPFDWLICPLQSASCWLDAGLPDFDPDEIIIDRDHACWPKFNFWFWHGFYTKSDNGKVLDIRKNVGRELEKLHYQRRKFSQLDPETTVFVASNTQNNLSSDVFESHETGLFSFSESACARLETSLSGFFGAPVKTLFFSRKDRVDAQSARLKNMRLLDREATEWKGSDKIWDMALNSQIDSKLLNL